MSLKISQTLDTETKQIKNFIEIDNELSVEISKEDYERVMNKFASPQIKNMLESGKSKLYIKDSKPLLIEDDGVQQL